MIQRGWRGASQGPRFLRRGASWPSSSSSSTYKFQYNAAGLRIRKTTGSADINYVLNGDQVLAETERSTNAVLREYQYYPGSDRPHALKTGNQTYRYLYEEPGNVIALVDSAGAVVNRYEYDPFGVTLSSTVTVTQPFRFASREMDAETGFYYNRARYYDPELMRFISEDPIGLAGGINRYAYAANDPVDLIDPSGLDPCSSAMLQTGQYYEEIDRWSGATVCLLAGRFMWGSPGAYSSVFSDDFGGGIASLGAESATSMVNQLSDLLQTASAWAAAHPCATAVGMAVVTTAFDFSILGRMKSALATAEAAGWVLAGGRSLAARGLYRIGGKGAMLQAFAREPVVAQLDRQ